jgi:hypothetical protein
MFNKNHLHVKETKNGPSLFIDVNIPANSPIYEFTGNYYSSETLPADHDLVLQIGPDLFMGPSGGLDDSVNHSCAPNCYIHIVGKRVILYSLFFIKANSELTIDYSLSSTDNLDDWKMECKCGSINCRKVISGYQYLSDKVKEYYDGKNIVPLFIKDERFK